MGAVWAIFNPVAAFIGSVLGSAAEFMHNIFGGLLHNLIPGVNDFIFDYIIEPIMQFLGFHDEDIYKTEIIAVRIFDEDLYTRTQLKLATEYMKKESKDALWYATNFANTGDTQFNKYYRFGKWYYLDYLPSIQVTCTTIKEADMLEILKSLTGEDVFITDIGVMAPPDEEWCKWLLQENYGYNVGDDYLILDDKYYTFGSCTYDANLGDFVVTLSPIEIIKERVIETTKVYVSETAEVTIHTYNITEIEHSDTQVKITKYSSVEYILNEEILKIEETPKIISYSDDLTLEDGVTKELISSTVQTFDVQRTIISHTRIKSNVDTSIIISDTTDIISDTEIVVLEGSGQTYTVDNQISNIDTPTGWSSTTVRLPYHDNIRRYLVRYSSRETGRKYLFMYNTLDGTYPALSNPVEQMQGLEGYPICMLRNGFNDINNYNGSGQHGHGKPSSISKKRYDSTKRLMESIGIDINDLIKGYSNNPDIDKLQDCFYMYGISPSDSHWIVSRALYEMFDFIYDKFPYTGSDSGCSVAFKENPYNAAIMWTSKPIVMKTEKIGSLGKCTHSVISVTITKTTVTTRVVERTDDYRTLKVTETTETTTTSSYDGVLSHSVSKPTVRYVDRYSGNTGEDGNFEYQIGTTKTSSSQSDTARDLFIKKQITPTITKTLRLHNTGTFSIIRATFDGYSAGERLDIGDSNLVIPLPVAVVNRLTLMEKTALLGRSAYMIFYAFQHQHIKWYQTEAFAGFMSTISTVISIVVAIVVTIVTFNPGTGASAGMSIGAVLGSLFKTALIAGALQLALYIINETVQDVNLKIALSVVASIAAMALGGAFNSIDFNTVLRLAELPVMAANIYAGDTQMKMQDKLQADASSFQSRYESTTKQYSDIIKSFNTGLSTEATVGLAVDATEDFNASSDRGFMFSPSQFYSMATTACYNYDALYTGYYDACVHRFVRDRKMLGIFNDEGDE